MQAIPLVLEGEILMNSNYRWVAKIAFFCALLSLASLSAQAQTYVFGTASYSAPGVSSNSPFAPIVTADFNRDGIPDVAILGPVSSGQVLSIFLGRPDGSFGPRVGLFSSGERLHGWRF
jgi:hypothetical protein